MNPCLLEWASVLFLWWTKTHMRTCRQWKCRYWFYAFLLIDSWSQFCPKNHSNKGNKKTNFTYLHLLHLLTLVSTNILQSSSIILPILFYFFLGPGAFRLHSTAYIQLYRSSEHGGDTSIDTSNIQSFQSDMMQCWASIINLINQ